MEVVRINITGTSGVIQPVNVVSQGLSLELSYQKWENLTFAILIYVGGIFSNFIIYILAIYWALRSSIKESNNIFLFIFLSIGIIPIFIGDEVIQARTLYNIPFQIPAAIALTQMMKTNNGKMMAFALCMWILFVSTRTLFHLYHIVPQ